MRRTVGVMLILLGLAHVGAGTWAAVSAPILLAMPLWWFAMIGFIAAGVGLLGISWLDRRWRVLACIGALASLGLLSVYWHPALMIGAAIDAAILLDAIPFVHGIVARTIGVPVHPPHRHLGSAWSAIRSTMPAAYRSGNR
jgi:hypothetical protein